MADIISEGDVVQVRRDGAVTLRCALRGQDGHWHIKLIRNSAEAAYFELLHPVHGGGRHPWPQARTNGVAVVDVHAGDELQITAGANAGDNFAVQVDFSALYVPAPPSAAERQRGDEAKKKAAQTQDLGEPKYKKGDIIAAAYHGDVKQLEQCLDLGANVDEQDSEGSTPLIYAAVNGRKAAVDFLITRKANVNYATPGGRFALWDATYHGHKDVCESLIKAGADKHMKSELMTAGQLAAVRGHKELAAFIDSWNKRGEATRETQLVVNADHERGWATTEPDGNVYYFNVPAPIALAELRYWAAAHGLEATSNSHGKIIAVLPDGREETLGRWDDPAVITNVHRINGAWPPALAHATLRIGALPVGRYTVKFIYESGPHALLIFRCAIVQLFGPEVKAVARKSTENAGKVHILNIKHERKQTQSETEQEHKRTELEKHAHVAHREGKVDVNVKLPHTSLPSTSSVLAISDYRLHPIELGKGAFAAVFRAVDKKQRLFAIKRYFLGADAETVEKETSNITRIWSDRFDSPFLVRFFHTLQDPGDDRFRKGLSLVFELCEEGSLVEFIHQRQRSKLPFLTTLELLTAAIHLTSGLEALHGRELVHKDIAPRNIFIARNEAKQLVFKIGDVGLCKLVSQAPSSMTLLKISVHTAPDMGEKADLSSDVFSLGVVLYELATLKVLDVTNGATELKDALANMLPERQAIRNVLTTDEELQQRYGKSLLAVIAGMLSEHGATRHTTASALHALSHISKSEQPFFAGKREREKEQKQHETTEKKLITAIPISDLEFVTQLGLGGFGAVWSGKWISRGKETVAIKRLHAHALSEEALEQFKRECHIMQGLRSNYIINIFGACFEPGHPFCIVMELAARGSLYGVLHSKTELTMNMRYRLALESARGLLHLHECKILHRDIKSANILVTEDWHAKLGDFGLAKVRTETRTTTKTPAAATSLRWTAPEMFKLGAKFTEACDVFSFGVLLFEIATREIPHGETEDAIIIDEVKKGERQEIPASVPKPLCELITRCWTHDAVKRPTMHEVVAILEPLVNASPVSPSGPPIGPKTQLLQEILHQAKRGADHAARGADVGEQIKEAVSPSQIPGFDSSV